MKQEEYFKIMDCVSEQDVTEMMQFRRSRNSSGREQTAGMTELNGSEKHDRKTGKLTAITAAAAFICVTVTGCILFRNVLNRQPEVVIPNPGADLHSEIVYDSTAAASQTEQTASSQSDTETESTEPVKLGDGIYEALTIPPLEHFYHMSLSGINELPFCVCGSTYSKAEAFGHTLDFSDLSRQNGRNVRVNYCILKDSPVVYFTDDCHLYKSDCDRNGQVLLFDIHSFGYDSSVLNQILAFPNTDRLFIYGIGNGSSFICQVHSETGQADLTCYDSSMMCVPCNTGVMLYTDSGAESGTVLYWEDGEIYEIPLQNKKEAAGIVYISENGKYLCTEMDGKTKDGKWLKRYSVYDTKNGEYLKSFDWKFDRLGTGYDGFYLSGLNDEAKSIYVIDRKTSDSYQFCFGE